MKIVLSGGGNDINKILEDVSNKGVFLEKKVAYVIIASEPNEKLNQKIKGGFPELSEKIKGLGATEVILIDSNNVDCMFENDCIFLSGGDTNHLINILREHSFSSKLKASNVQVVVGISAGALALSKGGWGTKDGNPYHYQGFRFVEASIVPHSDEQKKQEHPDSIHLEDYALEEFEVDTLV